MEKIGKITHFFDKINVAVLKLDGTLKVGNTIQIGDGDEAFEQEVTSMQVNHKDIKEAKAGDDVGLKTKQKTRAGANVYLAE